MDTATDQSGQREQRHLLDHPQPLGILPTLWFWNDRANWRRVSWAFGTLGFIITIAVFFSHLHPLIAGLVAGLTMALAIGLLEKYVRHQAVKRRALAESATLDALGERRD
jgi:hypothetical protein